MPADMTAEEFDDWMREVNGDMVATLVVTKIDLGPVKTIGTTGHLLCGYCAGGGMKLCPIHGWTS